MIKRKLTYLDLFCGTGGFSLGFERAGFKCLGAIDFDGAAIETYKRNFPNTPNVIHDDIRQFGPKKFEQLIDDRVDVIIGGPPCQGFSTARMRDGANHGKNRFIEDPRRLLFREFLNYIEHFQPKAFVFENVPGIRSVEGGKYFQALQEEAREIGYHIHASVVKAWEHGVPQKRIRQLVIGQRDNLPKWNGELTALLSKPKADLETKLWEAIGDLPLLKAGQGEHEAEYDLDRRKNHIERYGKRYLEGVLQISKAKTLTAHVSRAHSDRDLRDFAKLYEGETSAHAIKRGETMEFPYSREHFKDRYTRQHRNELCSTIVAHLSKDGLMFIHPTQNRSLTPREAARIQSFPDWFEFPSSRTHAYRLIGNAVPPLVAEKIGKTLSKLIK